MQTLWKRFSFTFETFFFHFCFLNLQHAYFFLFTIGNLYPEVTKSVKNSKFSRIAQDKNSYKNDIIEKIRNFEIGSEEFNHDYFCIKGLFYANNAECRKPTSWKQKLQFSSVCGKNFDTRNNNAHGNRMIILTNCKK